MPLLLKTLLKNIGPKKRGEVLKCCRFFTKFALWLVPRIVFKSYYLNTHIFMKKQLYISPEVDVLVLKTEGVICESGNMEINPWQPGDQFPIGF